MGFLKSFKYIDSFASMARKPDRHRLTFCAPHRQGESLSTDRKTRIDFEKTCGMDRFCKGVPKEKSTALRGGLFLVLSIFHFNLIPLFFRILML